MHAHFEAIIPYPVSVGRRSVAKWRGIMHTLSSTFRISRRDCVRAATALIIAGPPAPATPAMASRQTPVSMSDHPAVGAWLGEFNEYRSPVYIILHPDGTGTFHTAGTVYFTLLGDLHLPMTGVVVWQPIDETTIDAVVHVIWGDATDDTSMTIRQRWTFDTGADTARVLTRWTHVDANGVVINRTSEQFNAERLAWESFDTPYPATPQASPAT